jgi:hypothetical protein
MSITRVPKWYWFGERWLIPTKNTTPSTIYLALENYPMTESDYDFLGAMLPVRRINAAATTTISLPETDTGAPYFPEETLPAFRDTLFASAATERLAILAGGVPQRLVHYLRRDTQSSPLV